MYGKEEDGCTDVWIHTACLIQNVTKLNIVLTIKNRPVQVSDSFLSGEQPHCWAGKHYHQITLYSVVQTPNTCRKITFFDLLGTIVIIK